MRRVTDLTEKNLPLLCGESNALGARLLLPCQLVLVELADVNVDLPFEGAHRSLPLAT